MARLLVSVRNAAEAEAALRGGAGLIDIKEPARGSLGKAADRVIEEVVRAVAGRVPVSAALGELHELRRRRRRTVLGLRFVKYGLAGHGRRKWRRGVEFVSNCLSHLYAGATTVVAAYADWHEADAPPVETVCAYAREQPDGVFLVDTRGKDAGRTLLDWLSLRKLALLCKLCRATGTRVALAGSLGPEEIRELLPLRPDWIAVRGAACEGGRNSVVSEGNVRELVELLNRSRCGS